MFKDEYRKMNESIRPGSELLEKTERSMEEIMNRKNVRRMSARMAVALALVGVLALTGVAFATGAIQSVFELMRSWGYPVSNVDVEKLNELAETGFGEQVGQTDYSGEVSVELVQAYYDGDRMIVGAKYREGKNVVVMTLDHEMMAMTRKDDPAFCASNYLDDDMPVMIDQNGLLEQKSDLLPSFITKMMTDEEIVAFEQAYEQNGEAGMLIYSAGRSDGVWVDGEMDDIYMNEDYSAQGEDGSVLRYVDVRNLPDRCVNRESLTVTLAVTQSVRVIRADADGVWIAGQRLERKEFPFEVKKNDQNAYFVYGSFENEVYSTKAELRVTDLDVRVMLDMVRPEEWVKADETAVSIEEAKVDYIWDYRVVYQDGSHEDVMDTSHSDGSAYRMEGSIALREGQTQIILRPYYALSGLVEGEDIVISLENGIPSVK